MPQFVCNAQLFSRICGKDVHIMEATASFAEKAASIDSTSSAAMAEVGRQCLLRGRIKEAQKYYKVGGSSPFKFVFNGLFRRGTELRSQELI